MDISPYTGIVFFLFHYKNQLEDGSSVEVTYIIPSNYEGPIYVIHNVPMGNASIDGHLHRTYHLDAEGIALVREAPVQDWTHADYFYELSDGARRKIPAGPVGSIEDNPMNRADHTVRVYFPASGSSDDQNGCSLVMDEAYVESPARALSARSGLGEKDIVERMKVLHPGVCSKPNP